VRQDAVGATEIRERETVSNTYNCYYNSQIDKTVDVDMDVAYMGVDVDVDMDMDVTNWLINQFEALAALNVYSFFSFWYLMC
jgi:hypothetical protein